MQKLVLIFLLCLSLLPAQVTSNSVTYNAVTDLQLRPLPPTPPMGPAGTVITDPTYGNPILRATDTGCVTPAAAQINSWNADSTKFFVICTGMTITAFNFDGANMKVSRIGAISLANPSFSYSDPNLIYGQGGGNLNGNVIYSYNLATKAYTPVIDVSTLVSSYGGGIGGSSISANEWFTVPFDGIQDTYHYCLYYNIKTGQRKILDTRAGTVDGHPVTFDGQAPGFGLHLVNIDKSGRFVVLGKGDNSSAPNLLTWDTSNNTFKHIWPYGTGHNSLGWGWEVSGNGLAGFYMQWFVRPLDNPDAYSKMAPDVTQGGYGYKEEHSSWNNARPDKYAPVIEALTRDSWSPNPPGPWDDEILGISTEPNHPQVYRFGHTWDLFDGTDFWDLPRGNVSGDGRYFMFTSNWRRTINNAQDVFIIKLPLNESGGGTTPPPSKTATSTALSTSPNPSTTGQAVTLRATVNPGSATGTVQFLDGGTAIGTAMLNSGVATFSTSSLSAGNHAITAAYAGDSSYQASVSGAQTQVVNTAGSGGTTPPPPGGGTTPPPVQYSAGLVSNAGFENGTLGWDGFGNSASIDNSIFAAGSNSAKITAEASGERSIQQDIRAYSGVFYSLAAYVRTAGATSSARIEYLNSNNQVIGTVKLSPVSGNTDWTVIAAGDFAPVGAYTARIVLGAAAGSGPAWYDQVGFFAGQPPVQPPPVNPPPVDPPPVNPPPVNPPSYGAGMIANGGFENGADPWQGFGNSGTLDSAVFASGSNSARVDAAGSERSIQQDIRVYSGVFYTLAANVKTAGAASAARVVWLSSSGQTLGTMTLPVSSGNTDWKVMSAGDFSPAGAYTARIVLAAAPGSGSVWYDQVGFFPGRISAGTPASDPPSNPPSTPPANYNAGMAVNGGFEGGAQPWTGFGADGVALDNSAYVEGSNSAKFTAGSSERSVEQTLEVYSGVSYTLSVFVQTAGATSVARIEWLDLSGNFLSSTPLPAVSGDTSWKQLSATEFAPQLARQARIVLGTAPGSGAAWFDAVSFNK